MSFHNLRKRNLAVNTYFVNVFIWFRSAINNFTFVLIIFFIFIICVFILILIFSFIIRLIAAGFCNINLIRNSIVFFGVINFYFCYCPSALLLICVKYPKIQNNFVQLSMFGHIFDLCKWKCNFALIFTENIESVAISIILRWSGSLPSNTRWTNVLYLAFTRWM